MRAHTQTDNSRAARSPSRSPPGSRFPASPTACSSDDRPSRTASHRRSASRRIPPPDCRTRRTRKLPFRPMSPSAPGARFHHKRTASSPPQCTCPATIASRTHLPVLRIVGDTRSIRRYRDVPRRIVGPSRIEDLIAGRADRTDFPWRRYRIPTSARHRPIPGRIVVELLAPDRYPRLRIPSNLIVGIATTAVSLTRPES
jgi:hypothetical protein